MNYVESFNLFGTAAAQIPCIKGEGAPTTSTQGAVGCLYLDTASESNDLYKCVAVNGSIYTWKSLFGDLSAALAEIQAYAQSLVDGGDTQ